MFEIFDDLTNQQLKAIIKQYNHHLKINYSKMNRDELLKVIHEHFDIDHEKIKMKRIEPIYFEVPEKKTRKKQSEKKPKSEYKLRDYSNTDNIQDFINEVDKKYNKTRDVHATVEKNTKLRKLLPKVNEFKKIVDEREKEYQNKRNEILQKYPNDKSKRERLYEKLSNEHYSKYNKDYHNYHDLNGKYHDIINAGEEWGYGISKK